MDNETFLQKLNEVAELKVIRPPVTAAARAASTSDTIFRQGQEVIIDIKNNPTLNIGVKKLKSQQRDCEDCGKSVTNRVVTKSIYMFPQKHWREQCTNCRQVKNPESGKFDIPARQAQNHFTSILNKQ